MSENCCRDKRISRNGKKDTSKTDPENNQQIDNNIQNEFVNNSVNVNNVNPAKNFSLTENSNMVDGFTTSDLVKNLASLTEDDISAATTNRNAIKTEFEYSNAVQLTQFVVE